MVIAVSMSSAYAAVLGVGSRLDDLLLRLDSASGSHSDEEFDYVSFDKSRNGYPSVRPVESELDEVEEELGASDFEKELFYSDLRSDALMSDSASDLDANENEQADEVSEIAHDVFTAEGEDVLLQEQPELQIKNELSTSNKIQVVPNRQHATRKAAQAAARKTLQLERELAGEIESYTLEDATVEMFEALLNMDTSCNSDSENELTGHGDPKASSSYTTTSVPAACISSCVRINSLSDDELDIVKVDETYSASKLMRQLRLKQQEQALMRRQTLIKEMKQIASVAAMPEDKLQKEETPLEREQRLAAEVRKKDVRLGFVTEELSDEDDLPIPRSQKDRIFEEPIATVGPSGSLIQRHSRHRAIEDSDSDDKNRVSYSNERTQIAAGLDAAAVMKMMGVTGPDPTPVFILPSNPQLSIDEKSSYDINAQLEQLAPEVSDLSDINTKFMTPSQEMSAVRAQFLAARNKQAASAGQFIEDQAEESDDGWAGLGGASSNDEDDDAVSVPDLVDDARIVVDSAKLRELHAAKERERDRALAERLAADIHGGWRRRQHGNRGLAWSESEEDDAPLMEEAAAKATARRKADRNRARLLASGPVAQLAADEHTRCFAESIANGISVKRSSAVVSGSKEDELEFLNSLCEKTRQAANIFDATTAEFESQDVVETNEKLDSQFTRGALRMTSNRRRKKTSKNSSLWTPIPASDANIVEIVQSLAAKPQRVRPRPPKQQPRTIDKQLPRFVPMMPRTRDGLFCRNWN